MTEATTFATLNDVSPRDAWANEALHFTPWLAENLDRLAQVIGIPLELVGAEVSVQSFSADILAKNPLDDTLVLIENQLEASDHTHLGQIMTYLAGLSAHTIIWIAPSFREPHLSAVRWLNQHTADDFLFFAVKVRVVRIGTSPFAPLFEVMERPNGWDRTLQEAARESQGLTQTGTFRRGFWTHHVARHPAEADNGPVGADSSRWRRLLSIDVVVVQYIAKRNAGVFIRGPRGADPAVIRRELADYEAMLAQRLSTSTGDANSGYFGSRFRTDTQDPANWDAMSDWLAAQADRYAAVLTEVVGAQG